MKKGKVTIEFAILKNGTVAGMKLVSASGDVALDRGAWFGITASNPFRPYPTNSAVNISHCDSPSITTATSPILLPPPQAPRQVSLRRNRE
jgi:TonB family protein